MNCYFNSEILKIDPNLTYVAFMLLISQKSTTFQGIFVYKNTFLGNALMIVESVQSRNDGLRD